MTNDSMSLSHTKWNCKYHIRRAQGNFAGGMETAEFRRRKSKKGVYVQGLHVVCDPVDAFSESRFCPEGEGR